MADPELVERESPWAPDASLRTDELFVVALLCVITIVVFLGSQVFDDLCGYWTLPGGMVGGWFAKRLGLGTR